MRKRFIAICGGTLLSLGGSSAHAAVLIADFNDITAGALAGKAGGTGFSGTWSGSAATNVVAGDLTSSLYNVPQSGTPQAARNANTTGLRQNFRNATASPTGTVWFSFLAKAEATGDRAGISINPSSTISPFDNPGNSYAYFEGDTLKYSFGAGTASTLVGAAPVASTALIVGKVVIDSSVGGADAITLWVNPDLIANPDINTLTPVYNNSSVDWLTSVATVGAVMARKDGGTSGGGDVDNIRFSDGGGNSAQAFADVTNVPEPASLGVLGLAVMGLAGQRKRRMA